MVALPQRGTDLNGGQMIDFKVEESGDKRTLTVNGELTIHNAAAIQGVLIRLLESREDLHISLKEVSEVDLSFLQLLCSAHKTSKDLNTHITMSGDCPEIFRDAVRTSGLLQDSGCRFNCDKNCTGTELHEEPKRRNN